MFCAGSEDFSRRWPARLLYYSDRRISTTEVEHTTELRKKYVDAAIACRAAVSAHDNTQIIII
jgi:hypothetical protein